MTHPFQEDCSNSNRKQSAQSPGRKISSDDRTDKKRNNDGMLLDASAGMPPFSPSGDAARSHAFLAPRSDGMQEQFDVPGQDIGAAWVSVEGKATEKTTTAESEPTAEEFASWSRSERKRFREKKRRGEVNKGFDDLMSLLLQVDPTLKAEVEESEKSNRKHHKSGTGEGESPILNRVDLIARAVKVLRRVSRENEQQKALLAEMSQGTGLGEIAAARQAIKDDRVLLMIPFLAPQGPVASATTRGPDPAFSSHAQQQALGLQAIVQNAASLGPSAPYHNRTSVGGYPVDQWAGAGQLYGARNPHQGFESGFNQGYIRPMQNVSSVSNVLNPDLQHLLRQQGGGML